MSINGTKIAKPEFDWKEAEVEVIDELNERLKSCDNNHKETKKAIEVKEKWHQQVIKTH